MYINLYFSILGKDNSSATTSTTYIVSNNIVNVKLNIKYLRGIRLASL